MVNQRLTELNQATEEWFVIVVIPTGSQDTDHLKKNIEKYGKSRSDFLFCFIIILKNALSHTVNACSDSTIETMCLPAIRIKISHTVATYNTYCIVKHKLY